MAVIGLVGVLLNLVVVREALAGVHSVDVSYEGISRLAAAQRYFQHADMMHDALHADVLEAVLSSTNHYALRSRPQDDIRRDGDLFRSDLARVDTLMLPEDIERSLADIRGLQNTYIDQATELGTLAQRDVGAAQVAATPFLDNFQLLETRQDGITAGLVEEAAEARATADRDERNVQWRLIVASVGAILGFVVLAFLLIRVGRTLSRMVTRQRDVAETLQHSLLPEALPDLVGVQLAARYLAGGHGVEVGGDWYDVLELPNGEVGIVMGDVVGHDLRAAAVMGQMRNVLRAYAAEGTGPGDVLERLNRFCHQQNLAEMASCVYAVLDPVTSRVRLASAGHYPPLVTGGESGATFLEAAHSPPIGAVREVTYPVTEYQLLSDDILILFTDGLVERRDASVDEGLDLLRRITVDGPDDLGELCDHILSAMVETWAPHDDIALLVVAPKKRLGNRLDLTYDAGSTHLASMRQTVTRWLEEVGATDTESYEILVACSEAATNAIEHAYGPAQAYFSVTCLAEEGVVEIVVRDWGCWRDARGADRGRGRMLMEGLMDEVRTKTAAGGTEVWMTRSLSVRNRASVGNARVSA